MTQLVAIELDNIPAYYSELLQDLHDGGFQDPFIYGGALRDIALNQADKINDVDISIPLPLHLKEVKINEFNQDFLKCESLRYLKQIQRLKNVQFIRYAVTPSDDISSKKCKNLSKDIALRIDAYIEGQLISFFVETRKDRLQNKFKRHDAPINSVYMDKDQQVFAHPEFKSHVEQRIYAINPYRKNSSAPLKRYNRLQNKIKGLTLKK